MFKNINILKQMSLIFIFIALFTISPMLFAVDGLLKVQFYDENSLAVLDGNVSIVDVTNNVTYNPDANGYWDTNLTFLNWEDKYINAYVERKVDGLTTHTRRNFQFYWNADQNYDLGFALLPVGLGEEIEFLVKDTNNELWRNKYVQFKQLFNFKRYDENINVANKFPSWNTYPLGTNQLIHTFNLDKNYLVPYITYNIYKGSTGNYTTNTQTKFFYNDNTTSTVNYDFTLLGTTLQSHTINNNNLNKFVYKIEFYGTSNSTHRPSISNLIVWSDGEIFNNYFINSSSRTSSTGIFSDYLLTDGDYNAVLYDTTGTEGDTYTKSTVNLFKPLDEKTEAEISPYDVQVGGLLNYTLSNQTDANIQFNVFAGLLNQYYNFRVVDYNATVSDQEYVPRNYVVAIPLGTSYQETYNLQPYLLKKEDAIVPKIYTVDILGNSIDGVQILITKNIDGVQTLVESGETISGGTMSFTAYPLDTYQILAYYQGELKAQGTIVPRTSADVYTITIDILPDKPLQDYFNFNVNWKTTKSRFNIVDENINILFRASVNLAIVDDYTVTLEKAGVVVGTATVPYAGFNTDANVTFNKNLFTTADISSPIIIRVKANLSDGSTISRTKQVYLSGGGLDPITSFQKVPEELGQPLAIIIAFLVVGFLIGFLMMSGFVRDPVKIGYFGIFLLAPFVMLGFFDMGVTVLGVDIGKFFYSLAVIVTLYLAMRELR